MKVYLHVLAEEMECDYCEVFTVADLPAIPRVGDYFWLSTEHKELLKNRIMELPTWEVYKSAYEDCQGGITLDGVDHVLEIWYGLLDEDKFGYDYSVHILLGSGEIKKTIDERNAFNDGRKLLNSYIQYLGRALE